MGTVESKELINSNVIHGDHRNLLPPRAVANVHDGESLIPEPLEILTKQAYDEALYVLRGYDQNQPAWHVILANFKRLQELQDQPTVYIMEVDRWGRHIYYRDADGNDHRASGFGIDPPESLMLWLRNNYDPCTIDANISMEYHQDDIRLCTIKRKTEYESIGVRFCYHRHEAFHYVVFDDDQNRMNTLAHRAGIRPYDRVIEYNGESTENLSAAELLRRSTIKSMETIQLLVCSPATYHHHKKRNQSIHRNYLAVMHIASTSPESDDEQFLSIVPDSLRQQTRSSTRLANIEEQESTSDGTNNWLSSATLINSAHEEVDNFVTAYPQFSNPAEEPRPEQRRSNGRPPPLRALPKHVSTDQHHDERVTPSLFGHVTGDHVEEPIENQLEMIRCQSCGTARMFHDRYRCLECEKYDLCGMCFDQRCETENHHANHAMVYFTGPNEIFGETVMNIDEDIRLEKLRIKYARVEQKSIRCTYCHTESIKGLYFKCDSCRQAFLCFDCMKGRVHEPNHTPLAMSDSRFLEIPFHDIELQDEIGRGGFGTVHRGKWLSKNRIVACKVISVPPDKKNLEKSFRQELAAYTDLFGPNILRIYGYNMEKLLSGTERYMLIMEYMHRGSLSRVIIEEKRMSLRLKVEMACQIASGMRKLHMHQMIHRDIRPDNILISYDYTAKIGDMGIAREWLPEEALTVVGCMSYMPLEFYTGIYDQSLDVFTYALTINQLFIEAKHKFSLLTRKITLVAKSPVFDDLIDRCLSTDPKMRPCALEIELTLRLYKEVFERYITKHRIRYAEMSLDEKNELFIDIYVLHRRQIDASIKTHFSPMSMISPTEMSRMNLHHITRDTLISLDLY